MESLSQCTCGGVIPLNAQACPNCEAPILDERSPSGALRRIASIGGGIAMAVACNCYGVPLLPVCGEDFCQRPQDEWRACPLPDGGGTELCCPHNELRVNENCPVEEEPTDVDGGTDAGLDGGADAADAGADAG
jgi:hypothetical protein